LLPKVTNAALAAMLIHAADMADDES